MADVRGLVGIDAGVLDKRVYLGFHRFGVFAARAIIAHRHHAIETRIDVTGAGNSNAQSHAACPERPRSPARSLRSLAQLACKFKGNRRGELPKVQVRRRLQRDVLNHKVVFFFQHSAQMQLKPLFSS